jgi:protein phosphatase 4 regulatory subunit 3
MIDVMQQAEDLEALDNLHALCSLMQTICKPRVTFLTPMLILYVVMLNDHSMYEHILDDEIFFGVVGMLECTFSPMC